jgi:hypothetical protein
MNLYVLNEVLYDHTDGMAVIAAENLERMREIFIRKFGDHKDYVNELDHAIEDEQYVVLEVVGVEEGVISYVEGGS